jgi:hypothetical protein
MGKHEKIITAERPTLRAPAVISRLRIAERELADLKLQTAEHVLSVAEGKPGAAEGLAALLQKITALAFEIEASPQARELAQRLDQEALTAWRAAIQTLPPEEIISGITRDSCCRRCSAAGACVITGADPFAGPCAHPTLVGSLEKQTYLDNPKIQAVFAAACAKLGLTRSRAA